MEVESWHVNKNGNPVVKQVLVIVDDIKIRLWHDGDITRWLYSYNNMMDKLLFWKLR